MLKRKTRGSLSVSLLELNLQAMKYISISPEQSIVYIATSNLGTPLGLILIG